MRNTNRYCELFEDNTKNKNFHDHQRTNFYLNKMLSCIQKNDESTTKTIKLHQFNFDAKLAKERGQTIPNVTSGNIDTSNFNPMDFLQIQMKERLGKDISIYSAMDIQNFFHEPSPKDIESYDIATTSAIRNRNIEKLREIHKSGKSLQGCNKFGESLVHMACRRGFTDVVRYLINEAGVKVNIRDDFGRTPLHDACWTSQPNYDLVDILIREEPRLIQISDKRGFTPFQYTRKEHWDRWRDYLSRIVREVRTCEKDASR